MFVSSYVFFIFISQSIKEIPTGYRIQLRNACDEIQEDNLLTILKKLKMKQQDGFVVDVLDLAQQLEMSPGSIQSHLHLLKVIYTLYKL